MTKVIFVHNVSGIFQKIWSGSTIYPRQSTRKNVHVVATDLQGMSIHSMLFFLSVLPSKYTVVQLLIVLLLEPV